MNRYMILLLSIITTPILTKYTHSISLDQKVKNTPGTYQFIVNSPAHRFDLTIAPDQKIAITSHYKIEAQLEEGHIIFSLSDCLTQINLQIHNGDYDGLNITTRTQPSHRSAYGPSNCKSYRFNISIDTKNKLHFREIMDEKR